MKKSYKKIRKNQFKIELKLKKHILGNTAETCDTAVMGRGVPSGRVFGNHTCTCGTRDRDTAELPAPVLHPTCRYKSRRTESF